MIGWEFMRIESIQVGGKDCVNRFEVKMDNGVWVRIILGGCVAALMLYAMWDKTI